MKETTIVTAFFDIGRGDFNIVRCEPRSVQKYMDYFDFWARIKNTVIVYTQSEYAERIKSIRAKYGREKETIVIEIDNIFSVEKDIFSKMLSIEKNADFHNFRYWDEEVSNRADYDYIMLMKYWCMNDAFAKGLLKADVCWFDFGFNHGGEKFLHADEFDFYIESKIESSKINLFYLPRKWNPDTVHAGLALQYQFDTIAGPVIIMPCVLCKSLWEMTKAAMLSLISLDCIDDDQQLLLMSYHLHPELFELYEADWFLPLKKYLGGEHLTVRPPTAEQKKSLVRKVLGKIKRTFFKKKQSHKKDYQKRIWELSSQWYSS